MLSVKQHCPLTPAYCPALSNATCLDSSHLTVESCPIPLTTVFCHVIVPCHLHAVTHLRWCANSLPPLAHGLTPLSNCAMPPTTNAHMQVYMQNDRSQWQVGLCIVKMFRLVRKLQNMEVSKWQKKRRTQRQMLRPVHSVIICIRLRH